MRLRVIGLLSVLLSVTSAHAAGINLRWAVCFADGGVANKAFACNTNTGSEVLVGSFELGSALPQADGMQAIVDVASAASPLPSWWQFRDVGTCRRSSMFVSFAPLPTSILCLDPYDQNAVGGIGNYVVGFSGPNTSRVTVIDAVTATQAADLEAGVEYFAFNMTVNNQKTVGTGACAGCSTPGCIALNNIRVAFLDGGTTVLTPPITNPANGSDSHIATWQGGVGVPALPGGACAGPVPTREATWGAVKALYH